MTLLAAAILGYLLGSIPFGLLLSRLAGHGDIRRIGSGNIGATNVLRTGSKGLAALTLLLDAGKGALAVGLAAQLWAPPAALGAGLCVVLGHMFPVWLGFRGGKGLATALGVLVVLAWPVAVLGFAVWLGVLTLTRYSSLAGLLATVAAVIYAGFIVDTARAVLIAVLAFLIILRHHANIRRLIAGTESRISLRKG